LTGLSESEDCGDKITELTEASGTLVSPGFFSGRYPNNAKCRWRIEAKENMVSAVNIAILIN